MYTLCKCKDCEATISVPGSVDKFVITDPSFHKCPIFDEDGSVTGYRTFSIFLPVDTSETPFYYAYRRIKKGLYD